MGKILDFRFRTLALLISITTSCGDHKSPSDWLEKDVVNPKIPLPEIRIEPEFKPVIEDFKADAESYGVDLIHLDKLRIVEFGDPKKDAEASTVGVCKTFRNYRDNLVYTKIVIAEGFKSRLDSLTFKASMYHELGHCVLELDHSEPKPKTIMSPSLSWESFYQKNWEELVEHLFTGHPVSYQ